jgi:hypothetical protein
VVAKTAMRREWLVAFKPWDRKITFLGLRLKRIKRSWLFLFSGKDLDGYLSIP